MRHYLTVDLNKGINIIKQKKLKRNVMSVIAALFYMLQVEVHLRMGEICQQICVTQKTIIFIRNIQSIFIISF